MCASCEGVPVVSVCVGSLQEYDLNKDGLISYREFEMVRKVFFDLVCLLRPYMAVVMFCVHACRLWKPSSDTASELPWQPVQ